MIDKSRKKRVMITLPIKQVEWITQFCKDHRISVSHYISWMLAKKAEEMIDILRIDARQYTPEEYDEMINLIKTKWVDVDY